MTLAKLWKNYSLGIVYVGGWLLSWGLHYFGLWMHVEVLNEKNLFWRWFAESFENLASEYHQVGAFVMLTRYFIFRGSAESKDSDDEVQDMLREMYRAQFGRDYVGPYGDH